MFSIKSAVAVAAMVGFGFGAQAATIFDETVMGDLSNSGGLSPTILGSLGTGTSTIIGSIDAGVSGSIIDGTDEFDSFLFTVLGDFTVDFTVVGDPLLSVFNASSNGMSASSFLAISPLLTGTMADVFDSAGTLSAGSYIISLRGDNNGGAASYTVDINILEAMPAVPLPASSLMILSGLAGLGVMRRRKVKRSPN